MNPINFVGANANFGKPKDWDEAKNGPCATLPVLVQDLPGGLKGHVSLWVPTAEERRKLLLGSAIMLSCVGGQPVVALGVTDVPAKQLEVTNESTQKLIVS